MRKKSHTRRNTDWLLPSGAEAVDDEDEDEDGVAETGCTGNDDKSVSHPHWSNKLKS
jgi:hypothetical protein